MATKKQRDRKRAAKTKTKGLNIVPTKKKTAKKAKKETRVTPDYSADIPDESA